MRQLSGGLGAMRKLLSMILMSLITVLIFHGSVFAREGICGYEGGISSGEVPVTSSTGTSAGKTNFDYQEVTFITGKPIVLKGTLTVTKKQKSSSTTKGSSAASAKTVTTTTYLYTLSNTKEKATLSRTLVYATTSIQAENGQTTETTAFSSSPKETLTVNSTKYVLKSLNGYDFTRSNLVDLKPAVTTMRAAYMAGRSIPLTKTP
jgi:hypothetical protein